MLSYADKTFCASKVEHHTCNRELTEKDRKQAKKLGLPIAWAKFCEEE